MQLFIIVKLKLTESNQGMSSNDRNSFGKTYHIPLARTGHYSRQGKVQTLQGISNVSVSDADLKVLNKLYANYSS